MSWLPLRAPATKNKPAAVTVGCLRAARRKPEGLSIVLRVAQMEDLRFLRPRVAVDVLLGHGEHAGMLRIQPGREFMPYTNSKAKDAGTVFLRGVPLPKGIDARDREHVPVQFDYGDDWLEITLPDWARVGAAPATQAPRSYSLSDRVPDPAAALRGAGGRR